MAAEWTQGSGQAAVDLTAAPPRVWRQGFEVGHDPCSLGDQLAEVAATLRAVGPGRLGGLDDAALVQAVCFPELADALVAGWRPWGRLPQDLLEVLRAPDWPRERRAGGCPARWYARPAVESQAPRAGRCCGCCRLRPRPTTVPP